LLPDRLDFEKDQPEMKHDRSHYPMFSRSVCALFAALLLVPSQVAATCYWQNSTLAPDSPYSIAPDDTACFPDQTNSPCCGTGWTCLSDGVCFIQQGTNDFYYRGGLRRLPLRSGFGKLTLVVGTCTDRTWNSQQCPGWCFTQSKWMIRPCLSLNAH
jgi:hypothetical protein